MMSLTFGLFTQVSGLGPLGPLVLYLKVRTEFMKNSRKLGLVVKNCVFH